MGKKQQIEDEIRKEFGFCRKGLTIRQLIEYKKALYDNRETMEVIARVAKGDENG